VSKAPVTDLRRSIGQARTIRAAAVYLIALSALILAGDLDGRSPSWPVPAACIVALLVLIVMQTRQIGRSQALAREAHRPRMTPGDYRRLREMEIELGWKPTELPGAAGELPAPGRGVMTGPPEVKAAEHFAALPGDCRHPAARIDKGLCRACGTYVGERYGPNQIDNPGRRGQR